MARLRDKTVLPSRSFSAYAGPITIGAGYAVSKILVIRWWDTSLVLQIDFKLFVIAGIFLGILIRPIAQRIYWQRHTGFLVMTSTLLLMGPLGSISEWMLWEQDIELLFWTIVLPEIIPMLVVSLLASLILTPPQSHLTLSSMGKRLLPLLSWSWFFHVCLGAGIYTFLFVCFRILPESVSSFDAYWNNLTIFFTSPASAWIQKILYLWVRGIVLIVAILPVYIVIRGKMHELTLIFGSLLFVVADFLPIFANIYGRFPYELIDQIIQKLFIDFIFCYTIVLLFKKLPLSTLQKGTSW
ncbi:MAG: hypothetical protein HQM14_14800 [SAR324 cluster bacterium]|nr:hypothetical protein [SAR324 cluster bacterium]